MEKRIPSGSKIQPFFKPVHVLEIGKPGQPTEVIVHNGKLFVYNTKGQTLVDGGIIQTQGVAVGLKSWVHNIVFSATDQDTAAWASGTIYFGDGSSKAINAGNTGNITEKTYVYYDGTSILKKTTSADFLDDSYILLATIEEGGAGEKCIITVSQLPSGTISAEQVVTGFLSADRIDAGVITADKLFSSYIEVGGAAGDVNAGVTTISGGKITANSIEADRLNVSTLSAISANIGTITAGTITGITITGALLRTASSGRRIEIDDDLVSDIPAIRFVDTGGFSAYIYEDGDVIVEGANLRTISDFTPDEAIIVRNDKRIKFRNTSGGIGAEIWYDTNMDLQLKNHDDGSHLYLFTTGAGRVKINGITKTAIMATLRGYRELYCIESPEVWFMDFCESKDKIDSLFLEVTEGEKKFIKVENGGYQVWRRRKGFGKLRFEEKTEKEYHKNNLFWAGQR